MGTTSTALGSAAGDAPAAPPGDADAVPAAPSWDVVGAGPVDEVVPAGGAVAVGGAVGGARTGLVVGGFGPVSGPAPAGGAGAEAGAGGPVDAGAGVDVGFETVATGGAGLPLAATDGLADGDGRAAVPEGGTGTAPGPGGVGITTVVDVGAGVRVVGDGAGREGVRLLGPPPGFLASRTAMAGPRSPGGVRT